MFIQADELKSVMYEYQLQQIVGNDATIVEMAINAAEQEAKSYLAVGYNCEQIFSAIGSNRNSLIVELVKDIALYKIVRLANVDIIYEKARERYDRAIEYLDRVASGKLAPNLPLKTNATGEPQTRLRSGSIPKFRHSF
jgi:phage gp36-like protein